MILILLILTFLILTDNNTNMMQRTLDVTWCPDHFLTLNLAHSFLDSLPQ